MAFLFCAMTESDVCSVEMYCSATTSQLHHFMACLCRTRWDEYSKRSWRLCEKFQTL